MTDNASGVLFDLLHSQLVAYIYSTIDNKNKCVSQLESLGFRIGVSLGEQLTKDLPRFRDELEVMKFICRDFWSSLYQKQVDNLRTNHQGVYVLQDNAFKLLTHISVGKQYLDCAPRYLALSCGLIRGVLSNLGVKSVVTSEVISMPSAKFQIMVQRT
ncbi:trafficking protein particle complex subunit 6b-like [Ciona intestinalis]